VFITNASAFQAMNAAYRAYFPTAPPARATVICELMNPAFQVEISLLAVSGGRQALSTTDPGGSPRPPNPNLSAAIHAGGRVFLSGMLGITDSNADDAASQARETLSALGRTLQAAGVTWAQVTDAIVYLTDPADAAVVDEAWATVVRDAPPARTVVTVGLVAPTGRVEIMLNAVR
jgi:enamine deaminase RidA (YjgF/YER057c/UK114 family)